MNVLTAISVLFIFRMKKEESEVQEPKPIIVPLAADTNQSSDHSTVSGLNEVHGIAGQPQRIFMGKYYVFLQAFHFQRMLFS